MPQQARIIGYEAPQASAETVSPWSAICTCLPGIAAIAAYVRNRSADLPRPIAPLFWPLLAIGVMVGLLCIGRFNRVYRGRRRPWFVSLSIAAHFLVVLIGVPFLLLFLVSGIVDGIR
jgi:hypothetical protein